jgi:hypothetical protein
MKMMIVSCVDLSLGMCYCVYWINLLDMIYGLHNLVTQKVTIRLLPGNV